MLNGQRGDVYEQSIMHERQSQFQNGQAVKQLFFLIVDDKLKVDHQHADHTWHAIT